MRVTGLGWVGMLTYDYMEEMGVEFVSDVEVTSIGEVFIYFRGPDGYLYEIWKPVSPATA